MPGTRRQTPRTSQTVTAKTFDGETVGNIGGGDVKKGELDMYVSLAKAQNSGISDADAETKAKENLAYDRALCAFAKEKRH
ncbi:MAG: hypothetical protein L6V93_20380 [Clostridiales bacterium]|nr:MAG: hypothetical protein L6V93_20380 [Clostridiales bacterium]